MSAKHTPGPWFFVKHSWSRTGIYAERAAVADLDIYDAATEENQDELEACTEANAYLIAAAPELLAALEVVVADWSAQFERAGHLAPSWCKQARAAIAKATGEAA